MPKIGYCPGVWDMLHWGYINYLKKAKSVCDELVVGVQADTFVERQKGHLPVISESYRTLTLLALGCVDRVLVYYDTDYLKQAKNVGADTFILSEEYRGSERFKEVCDKLQVHYFPYDKSVSTTQIKNQVINQWAKIWEKVAMGESKNQEIVGHHHPDITWKLADYFIKKLGIYPNETVLDFGCGAGLILKEIDAHGFGIDVSQAMIARALKHYPKGSYLVCDHIPFEGHFDHIISWGVLHYIPTHKQVELLVDRMKSLSKSILLMEIPNILLREERLTNRRKMGKIIEPEPLYFDKQFFIKKGFKVLLDDPKLTDNSKYSFSVIYDKV